MTTTATSDHLRLFAFQQGPWRDQLNEQPTIDDSVPTTATVPPPAARGTDGRPLPAGTSDLLAGAVFGHVPALPADSPLPAGHRLGHLLVAAFGLQRREPSNLFNDHRTTASVRCKFPVHVFLVAPDGSVAYLDLYRHALIDLPDRVSPDGDLGPLLPGPDDVTLILSARYTDMPTPYGRLRCALGLLEQGINLRALHLSAQLLDVRVRQHWAAPDVRAAGRLVAASGSGVWSPPVVVRLEGVGVTPAGGPLPHAGTPRPGQYAQDDERQARDGAHPFIQQSIEMTAALAELSFPPAEPVSAIPETAHNATGELGLDWAQVLWRRTAGHTPVGVAGFTTRPTTRGRDCLDDLLAWNAQPPPAPLDRIGRHVRTTVAVQRLAGLETGRYALVDGDLVLERTDPLLMQKLQDTYGYPLSPEVDCGLRHATAVWMFCADLDPILAEFGPAGWSLLQLWCGWVSHGLAIAAAAHGLFARPARSYDEFWMRREMELPAGLLPVLTVNCGRSRFIEPMLDLRA